MAGTVVTRAGRGPVAASDPGTRVALWTVNTDQVASVAISTQGCRVRYGNRMAIKGGPGTAASVVELDTAGSVHRAGGDRAARTLRDVGMFA